MIFSKKHLGKSHVGFHEYQFVSGKFIGRCAPNRRREAKRDLANIKKFATRWWFQIFFVFTPTWGKFLIWLIHHQLNTYGDLWTTYTHTSNLKRYMEDLDCLAKMVYKENMVCIHACMVNIPIYGVLPYKDPLPTWWSWQMSVAEHDDKQSGHEELDANSCATAIHKAANYTAWESL